MTATINRENIYNLVKAAVVDGLNCVQSARDSGKYIGRYYRFPKNTEFSQSGLPHFHVCYDNDEPLDYKDIFQYGGAFSGKTDGKVDCDRLDSWQRFRAFALTDTELTYHLDLGDSKDDPPNRAADWKDWRQRYGTYGAIAQFVDRYVQLTGNTIFEEDLFRPIYTEWEADIFSETLGFDIWVPIICVQFESDKMKLDESSQIEKMPEGLQLARNAEYDATKFTLATHHTLIGAATHALVLTSWTTENRNREALSNPASFSKVLPLVENFFACLRVVVEAETGYSQIVAKPVGWGRGWKASLPKIYVTAFREYPEHLENFGWIRPPPIIDAKAATSIADLFKSLMR